MFVGERPRPMIGDPPKVCKLHSRSFPVLSANAFNTFPPFLNPPISGYFAIKNLKLISGY